MRSEYAEDCQPQNLKKDKIYDRRKSSNVSSSSVSYIVIGNFGLRRAGTAIKCQQCGLFILPADDLEHRLVCDFRNVELSENKQKRKSSARKPFQWIKKLAQNSAANTKVSDKGLVKREPKNDIDPNLLNRPATAVLQRLSTPLANSLSPKDSETDLSDRPSTAVLAHPSVLNLQDANSVDMTLSVKGVSCLNEDPGEPFRPETVTLIRPTPNLQIPTISPETEKKQIAKNTGKKTSRTKANMPVPCKTCARSTMPERLHSHGPPGTFKANLGAIKRKKKTEADNMTASRRKVVNSKSEYNNRKTPLKSKSFSIIRPHQNKTKNVKQKTEQKVVDKSVDVRESLKTEVKSEVPREKNIQANNAPNKARGPPTLVCFICGRNFGTKSLPLHEPHCLEKWHRENDKLPPDIRQPAPQKPAVNYEELSHEEQNQVAIDAFTSQLIPCNLCKRTFFPDRLPIHQKACKGKDSNVKAQSTLSLQSMKQKVEKREAKVAPPSFITCYICGRDYGSKSIALHEPSCLEKWRANNDKLPKDMRRPDPVKPEVQYTDEGKVDVEATRDALWRSHLDQLVPCNNCNRTFYPDRLVLHQRNCRSTAFKLS